METNSRARHSRRLFVGLLVAGAAWTGWHFGSAHARPASVATVWEGPTILQRVQALGDLHTVRYAYQNVFQVQSTCEPAGVLASFPGVPQIVHAATRNQALVSATGTVEAGVDLSQAKAEKTPAGTVLILPLPRVYPPDVRLHVHEARPGAFWRDDNLAVHAIDEARTRFLNAGLRQGILAQAEQGARERVANLLGAAGAKVDVRFAG